MPLGKLAKVNKVSIDGENDADGTFLVDDCDDDLLCDYNSYAENSFHSLHSDNCILRQIENMSMDPTLWVNISCQSGSTKRRIEDFEEDDASSVLKWKKN